ncbi:SDR family oxidoreductase [Rhabdobacter roseus]|uniref:Putative NADH-flavin reductase n=1 Tax=Rhabdobacter roseus TaxID=1655419 RepID=A0A840TX23_9BACT|nr:NAD(P)H-binding protein [Rhabdobacter roseus]MBB5285813.1 putative NADH-flavin reductase [Rhabdobacter roseus]
MKSNIKIAVLGGSGKAGRYLVSHLVERGYAVRLLLRRPESFSVQSTLIEVVVGDALDPEALRTLLEGCQAVISTLGQRKGEPLVASQATRYLLHAMECYGIRRYLAVVGLNLDTPSDRKRLSTRLSSALMKWAFPKIVADKQLAYQLLTQSTLDWTLVRIPYLVQTDALRDIRLSLDDAPGGKISAADLAHFLVDQLDDKKYLRQVPFIASN